MRPTQKPVLQRSAVERALAWRNFRDEFHLTQTDLATMLGINVRTVCAVETMASISTRPYILRRFHAVRVKHERQRRREMDLRHERPPAKPIDALLHYGKTPDRFVEVA